MDGFQTDGLMVVREMGGWWSGLLSDRWIDGGVDGCQRNGLMMEWMVVKQMD